MKDLYKNISIGVLVTASLALFIWMLLFLHPSVGDGKNRLRVRFANIDKVAVGTRVNFAGKPVGQVLAIDLVPDARAAESDQIFAYELTLALDSKVAIFPNDEVSIKTSGLMGERMINIMPKKLRNQEKPLQHNDLIAACAAASVDDMVSSVAQISKKIENNMDKLVTMEEKFNKALDSTSDAYSQIATFFKRANEDKVLCQLEEVLAQTKTNMKEFNQVMVRLESGQGTLGKLLNDDTLYTKTGKVIGKADLLLSDINNYGVLFHLSSNWQKERTKRLEVIKQLKTPEALQASINDEMEKILISQKRIEACLERLTSLDSKSAKNELNEAYNDLARKISDCQKGLSKTALQDEKPAQLSLK